MSVQISSRQRPYLYNDSFQYLSAANHFRSNQQVATSLVYFDTERSHGRMPAPLTWFPPGYPIAIALVSIAGFNYESAALLVSGISFVLTTGGVWFLVRMLDPSRWAARAAVLCWITNSYALASSISVLSESLFTALGGASLLFLVSRKEPPGKHPAALPWIAAAVTAALSYWVRYAGLLWVAAFTAVFLAHIVWSRSKPSRLRSIAIAASLLLPMMPLMLRNIALIGDWRGGNNKFLVTKPQELAISTPSLLFHLALGDAPVPDLKAPIALMLVGLVGLSAVVFQTIARRPPARMRLPWRALLPLGAKPLVLAVSLIYVAGIALIALRSAISYAPRMYVPVLPHLVALAVCGVAFIVRRSGANPLLRAATVLCLLFGYIAGNSISLASMPPDAFERTDAALRRPDGAGIGIGQRIVREVGPGEVLAATNGQAAGYVLNRPTLSLAEARYSTGVWDEARLRAEMTRFAARCLLVFRDSRFGPELQESEFLRALAAGDAPPWLRLLTFNHDICVYRVLQTPASEGLVR